MMSLATSVDCLITNNSHGCDVTSNSPNISVTNNSAGGWYHQYRNSFRK